LLTKPSPFVVLGLDEVGKPRAATFGYQDQVAATKAASVMGLKIGRADSPEAVALIKQLPLGRVFATGKGLMPLVKRDIYDRLLKLLKLDDPTPEPTTTLVAPKPSGAPTRAPPDAVAPAASTKDKPHTDPWSAITEGNLVLACTDPKEGWFPAKVMGAGKDGKVLTLKWRDYPALKPFEAKRASVGLIHKPR
jgi:hypothetical protein